MHALSWVAALVAFAGCLAVAVRVALRGDHVDFDVYRAAGRVLLAGGNPYADLPHLPFTYPPFALTLCAVAAAAPALGLGLLELLTLAVAGGSVWLVMRRRGASTRVALLACALSVVTEPVLRTLHLGQVNGLVLALVVADFCLVPPRLRGIATGLAAGLKLTPLVFVLAFLLQRQRSAAARMLATFAATVGVTPLLAGDPWRAWSSVLRRERTGSAAFVDNQGLWGLTRRLAPERPAFVLGLAGCLAVLALTVLVLHRLRDGSSLEGMLVCGLCGLLVSPISWSHHWILAFPLALALLFEVARASWPRSVRHAAVAALVGVCAVLVVGPQWLVGRADEDGIGLGPGDLALASAMTVAGLVLLLLAAALTRRPTTVSARRTVDRRLRTFDRP